MYLTLSHLFLHTNEAFSFLFSFFMLWCHVFYLLWFMIQYIINALTTNVIKKRIVIFQYTCFKPLLKRFKVSFFMRKKGIVKPQTKILLEKKFFFADCRVLFYHLSWLSSFVPYSSYSFLISYLTILRWRIFISTKILIRFLHHTLQLISSENRSEFRTVVCIHWHIKSGGRVGTAHPRISKGPR